MSTLHKTEDPVVLEGFQSIFEVNQYGKHNLTCIIGQDLVDALEEERPAALEWAKGKQKSKRYNTRLEPWEPVADGKYKVSFRWNPDAEIPIVDSEGTPITDKLPMWSGSMVKVAFVQRPYTTPDSIGTSLRLKALQVISCQAGGSVDAGDLDANKAAALFGKSEGFKAGDPNVTPLEAAEEDDEF